MTKKDLMLKVEILSKIVDKPLKLQYAYNGYIVMTEDFEDILYTGYQSKKIIADAIDNFVRGYRYAKETIH